MGRENSDSSNTLAWIAITMVVFGRFSENLVDVADQEFLNTILILLKILKGKKSAFREIAFSALRFGRIM